MNVLVVNHYFDQDIDAFRCLGSEHRYWSVSHRYFTAIAEAVFPKPVFTGLEAYYRPEFASYREQYAARARARLLELYGIFRFDLVLAPSDTFFWIRAVIDAVHELGLPFVVLQKEATVTEAIMGEMARELGALFPFIGDWMLVSSEFHRRFWIDTGAPSEIVSVTGQPRFDFYREPDRWKSFKKLGLDVDPRKRTVLFFTYDASAYLPMWVREGLAPWLQMREETEEALLTLARERGHNIVVKPHPQPSEDQTDHLEALAKNPGVFAVDGQADSRQLIVNSDVIIGFQSTVMFEAMAARKPTIYTYWTRPVLEAGDSILPFHRMGDALGIAHSADELIDLVRGAAPSSTDASTQARDRIFEHYLGPLDGRATERCLRKMSELAVDFAARVTPASVGLRRAVTDNAASACRRALPKALGSASAWCVIASCALPLYRSWTAFRRLLWWKRSAPTPRHVVQQFVLERRAVANEWLARCLARTRAN